MLETREDIRRTVESLAERLRRDYTDSTGPTWTDSNFETLRSFCRDELLLNPQTQCSHRRHPGGRDEFLWDFLAATPEDGVILVAESEQEAHTDSLLEKLKHDFEKLLYVFAPIRVLIIKTKDLQHEETVLGELVEFAGTCCLNFNPGSIFLLHCYRWGGRESQAYVWQSDGEPLKRASEKLAFKPIP